MLEKIEKYLEGIDLEELTISEIKLLTEIAIELDEHKQVKDGVMVKAVLCEGQ